MLTPGGLLEFKGINAELMEEILSRAELLPCINGGVFFNGRLEANEATDPDQIGYAVNSLAQNQKIGFGIEVPEGQVWFPYWVSCDVRWNTSSSYDTTLSPLQLEAFYTRKRRNNPGIVTDDQWGVQISNQYAAFTGSQDISAPYFRVGENPHNLPGLFKPQLYLGMWPSRSTIWFSANADNALGISGGPDRMLMRLAVNIVYTGSTYLDQLRDSTTADRELMRRLTSEGVTSFPNVTL